MAMNRVPILVVTGYGGPNYGTNLQSAALCKYFASAGHEVRILRRFLYVPYYLMHPGIGMNWLDGYINPVRKHVSRSFGSPVPYTISPRREKRLSDYTAENYQQLDIVRSSDYERVIGENTTLVVGSDILWQPQMMGRPGRWFLDMFYHTDLHRFSYATSIGANELPKRYYPLYRKYLSKFDAVGVREQRAVELLEPVIGRKATRVIDPTLLLKTENWDVFAARAELPSTPTPGSFVFCYFVMDDPRYWDYVAKVQERIGIDVIVLPMHHRDEEQPYTVIDDGTPYEFVWLVKNAALVVTDSFHACAFSLNYEKEFYLLRRTRRDEDAKYDDFLDRYGLRARAMEDETQFERNRDIDWTLARGRLAEDREFAYKFIDDALTTGRG